MPPTAPTTTNKRYLTRAHVCELLGWSRWALRRRIVTGKFPGPTLARGARKLERWPAWLVVGIAEGTIDAEATARDETRRRKPK